MAERGDEVAEVARWAEGIDQVHQCIGGRFRRPEPRRQKLGYLRFSGHPLGEQGVGDGAGTLRIRRTRENVIAVVNSGTGKTHVALGLGLAACQRGMSVGFTTAAGLVH